MNQTAKPKATFKEQGTGFVVLAIIIVIIYAMCGGEEEVKKDAATLRKEKIEKGFSAWNGSHTKLVEAVKSSMNDPNSFEHVETKYWDRDSLLVVKMEYTGKNGFGGRVRGRVMAHCSLDGEVLKIIESE